MFKPGMTNTYYTVRRRVEHVGTLFERYPGVHRNGAWGCTLDVSAGNESFPLKPSNIIQLNCLFNRAQTGKILPLQPWLWHILCYQNANTSSFRYLIWIGADQEKTFGPTIAGLIRSLGPERVTLWDSKQRGKVKYMFLCVKLTFISMKAGVLILWNLSAKYLNRGGLKLFLLLLIIKEIRR